MEKSSQSYTSKNERMGKYVRRTTRTIDARELRAWLTRNTKPNRISPFLMKKAALRIQRKSNSKANSNRFCFIFEMWIDWSNRIMSWHRLYRVCVHSTHLLNPLWTLCRTINEKKLDFDLDSYHFSLKWSLIYLVLEQTCNLRIATMMTADRIAH